MKTKFCLPLLLVFLLLLFLPSVSFAAEDGVTDPDASDTPSESCDTLGHNFQGPWEEILAPTCTEEGVEAQYCTRCLLEQTRSIPAVGHDWSGWEESYPPTCTQAGVETRSCLVCLAEESRETSPLGHDFSDNWEVILAPTCAKEGTEARYCSRCQAEETRSVPSGEHNWSDWFDAIPATCTEGGTQVRTCLVCLTGEAREIGPLGHDFPEEWEVTLAPTCTQEGSEIRRCTRCQAEETRVAPMTDHAWSEWVETSSATCTEGGTRVRVCQTCQIEETQQTGNLPHDFQNDWTVIRSATCVEEGLEVRYCHRCRTRQSQAVPLAAHAFSAWQTVVPPTAGAEGSQERVCQVCGLSESLTIPAGRSRNIPSDGAEADNTQNLVIYVTNEEFLPSLQGWPVGTAARFTCAVVNLYLRPISGAWVETPLSNGRMYKLDAIKSGETNKTECTFLLDPELAEGGVIELPPMIVHWIDPSTGEQKEAYSNVISYPVYESAEEDQANDPSILTLIPSLAVQPQSPEGFAQGELIRVTCTVENLGSEPVCGVQLTVGSAGTIITEAAFSAGEKKDFWVGRRVLPEDVKNGSAALGAFTLSWLDPATGDRIYFIAPEISVPVIPLPDAEETEPRPADSVEEEGTDESASADVFLPGRIAVGSGSIDLPVSLANSLLSEDADAPDASGKLISVAPNTEIITFEGLVQAALSDTPYCYCELTVDYAGNVSRVDHYCTVQAVAAAAIREAAAAPAGSRLGLWLRARDLCMEQMEKQWITLQKAAHGAAAEAVAQEKEAFFAQLNALEEELKLRYPGSPETAEEWTVRALMRRAVELCYEINADLSQTRPDSIFSHPYAAEFGPLSAHCSAAFADLARESRVQEIACAAHGALDDALSQAVLEAREDETLDAFLNAQSAWLKELNSITDQRLQAASGEQERASISRERAQFDQWLIARRALLAFLYPDQPAAAAEQLANAIEARVKLLCQVTGE